MANDYAGALEGPGLLWELPYSDAPQGNALNNGGIIQPNMLNQPVRQPAQQQPVRQQPVQQLIQQPAQQQLMGQQTGGQPQYIMAEPSRIEMTGDICEMFPYLPHCIARRMNGNS